eukprot:TRINITY_DN2529_c0_g1_i2.p2 TRINITY_DN2529_c0_g1~~TRINITY_DN2529_c0_g1_i2.p2  ORF type:complete len:105 (+),score=15.24 TRINITY_DN2529_c0_g1_i2:417-731(+)
MEIWETQFDHERELSAQCPAGFNNTYWCVVLATEEKARGRQQASALLRHGLSLADAFHSVATVETASEQTAMFYTRFGFQIHHSVPMLRSTKGETMWYLRRDAQ